MHDGEKASLGSPRFRTRVNIPRQPILGHHWHTTVQTSTKPQATGNVLPSVPIGHPQKIWALHRHLLPSTQIDAHLPTQAELPRDLEWGSAQRSRGRSLPRPRAWTLQPRVRQLFHQEASVKADELLRNSEWSEDVLDARGGFDHDVQGPRRVKRVS